MYRRMKNAGQYGVAAPACGRWMHKPETTKNHHGRLWIGEIRHQSTHQFAEETEVFFQPVREGDSGVTDRDDDRAEESN